METAANTGVRNSGAEASARNDAVGTMDELELQGILAGAAEEARDYIDGSVAPLRARATRYYRGEPFGNEEEGRSQVVMTEVRDVVQATMPGLLRVFVSSENVVEFVPTNARAVDLAEQQTDVVNHVFYQDNPGFLTIFQAFKDALVRKTGVIKWWWNDDERVTESDFTGITEGQVAVLKADSTVEILEEVEGELQTVELPPIEDPVSGELVPVPPMQVQTYDVRIRRRIPKGRVCVAALPPEELLIARNSRDVETSPYVAHRSMKYVSELVAMGYDKEIILAHLGGSDFDFNYEAETRNPVMLARLFGAETPDETMREVLYIEHYIRVDYDGDGIAELRKICTIGESYHILANEVADEAPFAVLCPDPEPHMVIGESLADQTMDLQEIKSNVVREMLNSLAQSVNPKTAILENAVNIDDVLNTENGAIVRMRQVGAVQPLTTPFVGQQAMPVIAYLDDVRAQRTGMSKASQGLDPDVLQSTTKAAVTATVTSAQERVELIARIFAETGFTRMFKGIARLLIKHQDQPRVLKLRGKWVEVNPKEWDADLECVPNVALGKGTDQEKVQSLMMIAAKQQEIILALGPSNPLCNVQQYRNTLAQICNLLGFKDASRYFGQIGPEEMQKLSEPKAPPPDPNMLLVQIEAQKATAQIERDKLKLQLEAQKIELEHVRAMNQQKQEAILKLAEIEAKFGAQLDIEKFARELEHEEKMRATELAAAVDAHGHDRKAEAAMHGNEAKARAAMHGNETKARAAQSKERTADDK